jgi:5-methylcytosine-specific restriction enzyme subunit McrC
MLLGVCQFIIEGMLLTTDRGAYKLASFVDEKEMFHLYEKFILEYYSKEFPQLKANASQIPWALDDGVETMLPKMQSDITLSYEDKILIIDAKFWAHSTQSQYDKNTIHSGNLYQIFTYVKNRTASIRDTSSEVAGMLLYARTDEMIQPDAGYRMSGNRISVKTLDLNREFQVIANQLNAIVEEFFGVA